MAGYICINCNSRDVARSGDNFTCGRCKFEWDVAHEQACEIYLAGQGREPAKSMAELEAEAQNAEVKELVDETSQDGAPVITPNDPNTPAVVNEQAASGQAEVLPEVPADKPSKGKAKEG